MSDLTYTTTFDDADWTIDVEVDAGNDDWRIVNVMRSDDDGETQNPPGFRLPREDRERIEERLRDTYGLRMPYGT